MYHNQLFPIKKYRGCMPHSTGVYLRHSGVCILLLKLGW